jgi:hypothetical protein
MTVNIEAIVRKLVLLGVPMLPLGCDQYFSSCPDSDKPKPVVMRDLVFDNPNRVRPDGAAPSAELIEAFRQCVEDGSCLALCRTREYSASACTLVGSDAGVPDQDRITVHATIPPVPCEGRRPDCDRGVATPDPRRAPTPLGNWLARAAYLERRSVPAFQCLRDELRAYGAPEVLVASAGRAVADERRHARMMTGLARRWGAVPARAPRRPRTNSAPRSLAAMAKENAAEGCVRETLGALLACWQATWAGDRRIRAAMRIIARDEARHAELAWQVHGWARSRLGASARRRVAAVLVDEAQAIRAEIDRATDPSRDLVEAGGYPPAIVAREIVRAADRLIWSAAAAA